MPPERYFDSHPEFVGAGFGGPALALAAITVLWLAALTWLLWPWIQSRLHATGRPAERVEEAQPTSVELLRQRYVMGQIDAFSFEEMLNHLLVSQVREHEVTVKEASLRGAGWEWHGRSRTEPLGRDETVTSDGIRKAQDSLEPHAGYG